MYAQLGITVFEGLFSWHEFERTTEAMYAKVELIDSKADLQLTGFELDAITFSIRLHSAFCDPASRYDDLVANCNNGDILPLVDGYGNIKGNFVLHRIRQTVLQEDRQGGVLYCECEVSLMEYVEQDKAQSAAIKARQNAFALSATSLTLAVNTPPLSMPADLFSSAANISNNTNAAASGVQSASANAATAADSLKRVVAAVNNAVTAANELQSKVENYGSGVVAGYDNIMTSIVAIKTNGAALITTAKNGDIANSEANAALLTSSTGSLGTNMLPLQKQLILR